MNTAKRFLLLLGYLACSLPILYFYLDIGSLSNIGKIFHFGRHRRQELRKQQLRDMCNHDKLASRTKHSFETLPELDNLIVNDKLGLIFCPIAKVACTTWKRILITLEHSKPYPDPMSFDGVHGYAFNFLSHFPKEEQKIKLKHYTKVLFVRHPFIRLISAYREKLHNQNWPYYQGLGWRLLDLYGGKPNTTVEEAYKSRVYPPFKSFVQFLVDKPWNGSFDAHWKQMHRLCHPCAIEYDFIGHQETLQEDAEEMLKLFDLENDIKIPPSYVNMTTTKMILDLFRNVPLENRRKLYKTYEEDFTLFGYKKPNDVLEE